MKLVTWNTQWCCGLDGVVSPQRIVEGARSLADFDVLCLQEVSVNYPGLVGNPGHDQPALLAGLLPGSSCSSARRWTSSAPRVSAAGSATWLPPACR